MKTPLTYKTSLFLLFQFLLINTLLAQEFSGVKSWDAFVAEGKKQDQKELIRTLAFDKVPTLYLLGNEFKTSALNVAPIRLITPGKNLDLLKVENTQFQAVEMLVVKLIDQKDVDGFSLNVNSISNQFENLKYMMFIVEYNATQEELANLFANLSNYENLQLFYQVSVAN